MNNSNNSADAVAPSPPPLPRGSGAGGGLSNLYPMPVTLKFCPGGVQHPDANTPEVALNQVSPTLLQQAVDADTKLNDLKTTQPAASYVVPSLSTLSHAVFGRLTGCPAATAKEWADSMILAYAPQAYKGSTDSASALLKVLQSQCVVVPSDRPRPCGYVFKRGDIAWNCRTCQTDPTCVICDSCFRNSNHDGHEVYFHRTTPGGCCDCGDAEAWKREGCCDQHRPPLTETQQVSSDDPMEAVRMAEKGQEMGKDAVMNSGLPKPLLAALGVVIGAAVNTLVDAVDGAAVGADLVQWRMRWADEASRCVNRTPNREEPVQQPTAATPKTFLIDQQNLPEGYRLHLRLHNDDVHTFDEVIDALHEPRQVRRHNATDVDALAHSLVRLRESATEMTHHVDSDGQVTVKTYAQFSHAIVGYRRLKSRGLHCAVVSTAQVQLELRARALVGWLAEIAQAHSAAAALVVHALVQVRQDHDLAGVQIWQEARSIPIWAGMAQASNPEEATRKRFDAFPPHLMSSYLTREESELLHGIAMATNPAVFCELTGAPQGYYASVPYRLPSERYKKSPHALWGTLPSLYSDPVDPTNKHPILQRMATGKAEVTENRLTESVFVVDLDLRKQQEADRITTSVFPHKLPGLHMISGVGTVRAAELDVVRPPLPSPMDLRHLLATSSFRAPVSPILLLLLFDPYPTKQMRASLHSLVLSLLTDSRFRSRFAGAIAVAYRPLSTLFCAGVGTEADTPLHFTVQIFTAGSLIRALGSAEATEKLLLSDKPSEALAQNGASIGVFASPIAHTIVRCIHTNLLGATKEVNMILNNTSSGNDDNSGDNSTVRNDSLLPALTYVAGEHPLMTPLPAAPDDGFLDSRSTRHKRLPHLLRDLEYVVETPGTAIRLLLPHRFPIYQGPSLSSRGEDVLSFPSVYARMLRLAQGMDPQKRKISGGHVEYEQNRWLEAFGLSLNFAGTRDALAESPMSSGMTVLPAGTSYEAFVSSVRDAAGNIIASLLREMKLWLYREGMLETGLLVSPAHGSLELAQAEALQRSTLHVSGSHAGAMSEAEVGTLSSNAVALACATGVKMTETQLTMIENALRIEAAERQQMPPTWGAAQPSNVPTGPVMGDWLRVPHAPLAGDSLSFHLPLHRALGKCVRSICSLIVPESIRTANPSGWWKIPVLDADTITDPAMAGHHPLVPLIRSTLRSSNCRVVWSAGPECSSQEASRRRARSRTVSANIAVAKILHSLADHPMRCIAAAQQIERHLWARNGSSVAGMAINYSSTPLCRSFRDLDALLVQISASGMSCGLGARRVFALLLSRFSMDGYLCDPERRVQAGSTDASGAFSSSVVSLWVNPPRLQDPDHAVVLSESFFSTLCVIVSELPPPPPIAANDDSSLRQTVRRELLHALAADPRSHSEAMNAAATGISRREETEGSPGATGGSVAFRKVFTDVLGSIAKQKTQRSSRAASGPPTFELKSDCCDEYDPTFFHLKRQEHQHAMDVVARLRKQKWGDDKDAADTHCLPLVCTPPKAHPRFLPCRLLLHLPAMDAAIRRSLLFALTGGSWLPPAGPPTAEEMPKAEGITDADATGSGGMAISSTTAGEVNISTVTRRLSFTTQNSSSFSTSRRPSSPAPFSQEVVAASSVSFLEVLQLLTLQVHTLEECASLHRTLPDLDFESRALSAGLSINSYLGRLIHVPESLVDVWALRPHPDGPLTSKGSGEKRGSVLGFLIALYEHRADHAGILEGDGGDLGQSNDGHGGARSLATSGLKWLLRFVHALVDGASSVGAATKSATTGVPIRPPTSPSPVSELSSPSWSIDNDVRTTIRGMLTDLPDLWPKIREKTSPLEKANTKNKEAGKAAQNRVLEMMKRKQAAFAATIKPSGAPPTGEAETADSEADLCIICRCDDADGENNGPLGYLGHVQRSRVLQMRSTIEACDHDGPKKELFGSYRVVGHMGCQLRETEAMDSKPLKCLPKGSVVKVLESKVSKEYDVLSRRVLVRHVGNDAQSMCQVVTEGWASVQSSQGYVILSPLATLCYANTSWGGTRPIIKQCGHAAHLKCVETHTLSLHQRAAGDQPYDGRFAANIADGEFLCPLCKQLSNILIPRDRFADAPDSAEMDTSDGTLRPVSSLLAGVRMTRPGESDFRGMGRKALKDFGDHLYIAMGVPWEKALGGNRNRQQQWNNAIQKWDYEEDNDDAPGPASLSIKSILRLLRQQLISWAAVGHSAAASEAGGRGVEEVLPFGVMAQTSDPWQGFNAKKRDSHPTLLALRRTLTASSGLLEVLCLQLKNSLSWRKLHDKEISVLGACLVDILEGGSPLHELKSSNSGMSDTAKNLWSEVTALVASMPCHVARDGVLPLKGEARATSAAMWATKGLGSGENARGEPPAPLAVSQIVKAGLRSIPRGWGTMDPFVTPASPASQVPFRPAVASAFLYKPLLAWDLYTLSGAVFSAALVTDMTGLPTSEELLDLSRRLLVGRMIQAIVTPSGFEIPDEADVDDEGLWTPAELESEGAALAGLISRCRRAVRNQADAGIDHPPLALLAGIGSAILPFARALILMMRACSSAIRERQSKSQSAKSSPSDNLLDSVLFDDEAMSCEDGFYILKALQAPLPSKLLDQRGSWMGLIERWLSVAVCFERHHGSSGKTVLDTSGKGASATGTVVTADTNETESAAASKPGSRGRTSSNESKGATSMDMDLDEGNVTYSRPLAGDGGSGGLGVAVNDMLMNDDMEDSEDEIMDMDGAEAEEMVDFVGIGPSFSSTMNVAGNDTAESDENSSSGSEGDSREADREFANVARSPILPYQPSTLALEGVGPGRQGTEFEFDAASAVMSDLSHLGLIHKRSIPTFSLIRLPKSFVELYNVVNKVKGRDDPSSLEENDDHGGSETAICLLTGTVMRSGSSRRGFSRSTRPPGACTIHARRHGSGTGIFFLVQKCTVLLMHNNKSAYSPSIYVDQHGEEDPGLRRGLPLFLNDSRYRSLESLWRQQGIPREVAQIRSTSDRVIRDNWY